MSALSDRIREWEQINGAELYKGQRAPLRRSEQDARNDIDESPPTKPTSLYPEGIYAPVYEPKTPQANGQPLMYPGVTHDWETVDGKEFNQVSAPELPVGAQSFPAADSNADPAAIQMQGLDDLKQQQHIPQHCSAPAVSTNQETSAIPADCPQLPLSRSASRAPQVLRRLHAGQKLVGGDRLESTNGLSTAILQDDGNFVVYTRKNLWANASKVAWATHTHEGSRNYLRGHELIAQEDGNLVVYTRDGKVAWASNTDNKSTDAYTLEVTDGGTLIWYSETSGEAIWTSRG